MTALEPILRAITFVEANLHAAINVADMAGVAAYSLYHFCRIFSKFTRHTPYDYLIRRRMTEAARDVITSERKIVDIAVDFQFESHEGFTRAFQRIFGIAPSAARREGAIPAIRRLPSLTAAHLIILQQQSGLIPEIMSPVDHDSAAEPVTRIAIPQRWPGSDEIRMSDRAAARVPLTAGDWACFALNGPQNDPALVIDWVLYAWLFYAPYTLRKPEIALQHSTPDHTRLYVPVNIP